jgi:hypothetical protein
MRKDKSALYVGARFAIGKCPLHAKSGKGSKTRTLGVYVCARNSDGEKAQGVVCAEHAPMLLAVSNASPSLF